MKVIAIVCSARKRGNCYDIAEIMIDSLRKRGVETEMVR